MLWVSVAFVASVGAAMIIWRNAVAAMIQMSLGARSHPGCAVAGGAILLLAAVAFALLYVGGVIPLR